MDIRILAGLRVDDRGDLLCSPTNTKAIAPPMIKQRNYQKEKMTRDVAGYLAEQQRKTTGDLAQEWSTIEELYNKK